MSRRSNVYRIVPVVALSLCALATAYVIPGIKVLSKAPNAGPIKYTVKMESKTFGNEQETRTIRSGQTDDFTWQGSAPSGAQGGC